VTYGKVLFYNEQKGEGIIITKENKKVKFFIDDWNDYTLMPRLGLEVFFSIDTKADEISAKEINVSTEKVTETIPETPPTLPTEKKVEAPAKKVSNDKCRNKDLEKIAAELNALLNDSSDNIDSLNAKISLSVDISQTMRNYFDNFKYELSKREGYKKVNGRLDYSLAKRFLWTTFNNLVDIDSNIVTLRIGSISNDLKFMSDLKSDFDRRIQYPLSAFEDMFLSSQMEYTLVKQITLEIVERLNLLKTKEEKFRLEKEKKKKVIAQIKDKELKAENIRELKVLNGTYVDIVHMMAKLQEIHKKNSKRLHDFESTYRDSFYKIFKEEAKIHQKNIIDILNAQAYLLDSVLWKEAKTSQVILSYFKSLSVDIELNTKTYLKYYLSTLDESKANQDTKDLFAFYDYLVEMQRDYILIVSASVQDALDYTQCIQSLDKTLVVKSFISELESIKWAMINTVKILVLEDRLLTTSAQKYLDYYHSHIFSKPKIILIGNSSGIKSSNYTITKQLPENVSTNALVSALNTLL
jgi:hypothetical protein